MKKIIVPTDFTKASLEGLFYAINIASKIKASVEIIHVYSGTITPGQPIIVQTANTYHDAAIKRMNKFINEALEIDELAAMNVSINGKAITGFPEIELIEESAKPASALIIMSTTGAHGISGKLFGTVSTLIAKKAKCPVLLIPRGASYKKPTRLMLASSLLHLTNTFLDSVIQYTGIFSAQLHCVHVEETSEDMNEIISSMKTLAAYCDSHSHVDCTLKTIPFSNSVHESLQSYVEQNEIGMTIMLAPKRSFFDALFHKSQTKAMAFSSTVPLLIFHK